METASTSSLVSPFPVKHKRASLHIKGNKTDIVVCRYDDYFLVLVTQIGCMGTILHARKEEGVSIDPTFSVSVIFGKRDEPLLVACGRQLIEHIRDVDQHEKALLDHGTNNSCGSSRPLVLSLGLKDHSMGTMKEIISGVIDNRLW